ncbi:MAG: class I SAM-dependent methyltransferase [Sulfurimonas sp.]|nr:class I SAM-dependent methyltransferase [Sulfurimonas sp.]
MNKEIQEHNLASAWFNNLYEEHKNNHENIPWAKLKVNPLLETYLKAASEHKGKALVIGCGLGDDAKALEVAGFEVIAIDVSQVALDLAQERFSDSKIIFEKQDIFDMPKKYEEYFDFIFEAFTIQSLPRKFRQKMIQSISQSLCKKGKILVVAHKKEHDFNGPPWPLEKHEIDLFKTSGLEEISFEIHEEKAAISNKKFKALYQKA